MRVRVTATFEPEPDKFFWLREPPDGSEVDGLRRRVAAVYAGLPPRAFMLLDAAMAGERRGVTAVMDAIPTLPEDTGGVPVRAALTELAAALAAAPSPPEERRLVAEAALGSVDVAAVERALEWVADVLAFRFDDAATINVETYVVASGVPLGGLTGRRIDDSRVCFVAARGQGGSTFAEALIHEGIHVIDAACQDESSLIAQLRREPGGSHQLWHAPYFVAAAEATRRFIDPTHVDYGLTHGYYAKVPGEMRELESRGLISTIRCG